MSDTTAAPTVCVDPKMLYDRLDDVEFIDVRTPGEFEGVHVPSAQNHPLDALDASVDHLRELVDQGREVVLVCRSGARAHQAQDALVEAGLPRLPILEGGMLAWQSDDGPVVQDVIRWDLERQVRFAAGVIVLVSILLSVVFPPARFIAGFLGAGLIFAAVTNTCAMGMLLTKLPYNRPTSA
ncbi:MAG: rhodanese-like domain-containing protein [Nitriliruptoraceae bacterium]